LLCYYEFTFYINRGGKRSLEDTFVHWEGAPTSFGELRHIFACAMSPDASRHHIAFQYPYMLAFEPTFVEMSSMSQTIQLRYLFSDTPPLLQLS
jgi:hypothetical protein